MSDKDMINTSGNILAPGPIPETWEEVVMLSTHAKKVRVFWDDEWEEYVCRLWIISPRITYDVPDADYHTDSREDAFNTALRMVDVALKDE